MTIHKLERMPYAQAHVAIDENSNIFLISYTTEVISITAEGWLVCYGTYSQTTRKHIGAFMKEYTPFDYFTAKDAYNKGYAVNINTGEIVYFAEEE